MSNKVISPCINNCRIDKQTGYCIGCLRTIDEITHWSLMKADQQKNVLEKVRQRRSENTTPQYKPLKKFGKL